MPAERLFRIGEKMVSLEKIIRLAEKALDLRERGFSQQEAARRLQIDRSFVSRLETVGEIRKGRRVAVIGFPIANAAELENLCNIYGLDFCLLMDNRQRWDMVRDTQALDFFNNMLDLVTRLREFDSLIMITSEKWLHLAEALLDVQIIYLGLGETPIREDRRVEPERLDLVLKQVLSGD